MAWYAYCLTEQLSFSPTRVRRMFPIEKLKGIGGAQVFAFPSGDFAAIVSEHLPGDLTQRSAYEHAHVVAECFHSGTVLPFRFGTVFDSEEALRYAIRANRKTFMATVARLRGKAEMHLKVTLRDVPIASSELPASVGNAYLEQLRAKAACDRERQSRARTVSLQVNRLFQPLQEEINCKAVPSGELLLEISHLIESTAVSKYQNRLVAAVRQLPNCHVSLSGPWPPYHFMPGKVRTLAEN